MTKSENQNPYYNKITAFRENEKIKNANEKFLKKLRLNKSLIIKVGYYKTVDELRRDESKAVNYGGMPTKQ